MLRSLYLLLCSAPIQGLSELTRHPEFRRALLEQPGRGKKFQLQHGAGPGAAHRHPELLQWYGPLIPSCQPIPAKDLGEVERVHWLLPVTEGSGRKVSATQNLTSAPGKLGFYSNSPQSFPDNEGRAMLPHWLPVEVRKPDRMGRKMASPGLGPEAE